MSFYQLKINHKDKSLKFNYPDCYKNYKKEFDEELHQRFANT